MSHQAVNWALRITQEVKLPPTAALLLILLADHHNPKHGCFPAQKKLSERLRVPERTVRWNIRLLEQRGYLRRRWRRYGGREYILNLTMDWTGNGLPGGGGNGLPDNPAIEDQSGSKKEGGTGNPLPVPLNQVTPEKENQVKEGGAQGCALPSLPVGGNEEPGDEEKPMKAEDVVKQEMELVPENELLAMVKKAKASPKGITPHVLGKLWRGLHALYLPIYTMAETTAKQEGDLHKAYKLAGADFIPALVTLCKNWARFRVDAENDKAVWPKPEEYPTPKFVLDNAQRVLVFHRQQKELQTVALSTPAKASTKHLPAQLAVEQTPAPPADPPATLAEVEAILSGKCDES